MGKRSAKKKRRRLRMYAEQQGRCHLEDYGACLYPGVPMRIDWESSTRQGYYYATFDHLVPQSISKNTPNNMKLAHRHCNFKRGNKDLLLC